MTSISKLLRPTIITFFVSLFCLSPYPSLAGPPSNHALSSKISAPKKKLSADKIIDSINPIDKEQQDCIDKNQTTAGMINCTEVAYKPWGREIDKNYAALLVTLSPEGKEALKASQSAWIQYRDKELLLLKNIYENISGTMYRVIWSQDRVNILKSRAIELQTYVEE